MLLCTFIIHQRFVAYHHIKPVLFSFFFSLFPDSVVSLVFRTSASKACDAITVLFNIFLSEDDYRSDVRQSVGLRMCLPLLKASSKEVVKDFFIKHIAAIMRVLEAKISKVQSTSRITTLGGASKKCPYSRSVVIPEVSVYVLQLEETLLWAWKCCRYSRIVVISAVVISKVDCMLNITQQHIPVHVDAHTLCTLMHWLRGHVLSVLWCMGCDSSSLFLCVLWEGGGGCVRACVHACVCVCLSVSVCVCVCACMHHGRARSMYSLDHRECVPLTPRLQDCLLLLAGVTLFSSDR